MFRGRQHSDNSFYNAVYILINFPIPKPQRPIALADEKLITALVARMVHSFRMLGSVQFDDEASAVLSKIQHINMERRLSAKAKA